MEEYAKTEQDISEEQLHQITGGCGQCKADLSQAAKHQAYAKTYSQLSDTAGDNGLPSEAVRYHKESIEESGKAQTLLEGVAGRGVHFGALPLPSKRGPDTQNPALFR